MVEQQLVAIMGADITEFQKAMKNVQDSMNGATNKLKGSMDGTEGQVQKSTGKMGEAFKKLGIIMATALAVDKLVDFGKFAINASAEAQAMTAQFSAVFGDFEGQAQSSIDSISKETGVLGNRMKETFTKMSSFAKVSGMDTADALNLGDRAMRAIADSSAFYDKSLEDVGESLQSFLKGNYENDAALGLSATETTRNAKANDLYGKSFNDLSESQKQLTLLGMVEDANKVSGALGQASRESDGFQNVLGNLRQAWKDFSAVIAEPILPIVIKSMQFLTTTLQSATTWVDNLNNSFGESSILEEIGATFTEIGDKIKSAFGAGNFAEIGNVIPEMVGKLLSESPSLLGVGANLINKIAEGMDMSVPELMQMVVEILGGLIEGIVESIPMILDTGIEIIEGLITGIIKAIPLIFSSVDSIIQSIATALFTNLPKLLELGMNLLTSLVQGIVQALPLLIEGVTTLITTLITMIVENLPMIIETGMTLLQSLIDGILSNLVILIDAITTVLTTLVQYIVENLPMIIQAGIDLLVSLIEGILSQLPMLISTILDLVFAIVDMVMENLPAIISAGVEILLALIDGIIEILPELITATIELIFTIVNALNEHLPEIIEAGIDILLALIDGIIDVLPELNDAVLEVVQAIFKGFADVDWLQIGKDILLGIGKGIRNNVDTVIGTVKDIAGRILQAGKERLGIFSPSKVFEEEVGKAIPEGIARGVEEESGTAINAVDNVSDSLVPSRRFGGRLNSIPDLASYRGENASAGGEYNFNIPLVVEGREIARAIATYMGEELERIQRQQQRAKGNISFG